MSFFKTYKTILISTGLILCILVSFYLDAYVSALMTAIQHPFLKMILGTLGSIEVIVLVLCILPTIYLFLKHKLKEIIYLWLGLLYPLIATFILKLITLRERPMGSFNPWGDFSSSFPSMHSAIVFSLAFLLSRYLPRFTVGFYSFAGLIAFSRIYFNFHYFSDIVTGSIVGIGIGWFLYTISNHNHTT